MKYPDLKVVYLPDGDTFSVRIKPTPNGSCGYWEAFGSSLYEGYTKLINKETNCLEFEDIKGLEVSISLGCETDEELENALKYLRSSLGI